MIDQVPPADSDVWHSALTILEDTLGTEPLPSIEGVRFRQMSVSNTAVMGTDTEVLLRVSRTPAGIERPDEVYELAMTPAFARYLAALLDAHARYIQTTPPPHPPRQERRFVRDETTGKTRSVPV